MTHRRREGPRSTNSGARLTWGALRDMCRSRVSELLSVGGATQPDTSSVAAARSVDAPPSDASGGDAAAAAGLRLSAESTAQALLERTAQVPVAPLILAVVMALAFVPLVLRNMGHMPWIMEDERLYSQSARLAPLSAANIPNYLFYFVYGFTDRCGEGFLDCARVLNVIFFTMAIPFVYVVARWVCSPAVALIICLVTLLGPANVYTAFFTPEAMYFFGFWVLTWAVLRETGPVPLRRWLVIGAIVGLLSLVKVHGLFLLPGLSLYVAVISRRYQRVGWVRRAALALISLIAATVLTKVSAGFLFAGSDGITLIGRGYANFVPGQFLEALLGLLGDTLTAIGGHSLVLAGLFGLPIVMMVTDTMRKPKDHGPSVGIQRISTYTLSLLITLVLVVAFVTAQIHQFSRLHLRYYDFLFPLLLIVVGARVPRLTNPQISPVIRSTLGSIVTILVLSAGAIAIVAFSSPTVGPSAYFASLYDAPWLHAWNQGSPLAYLAVAGGLLLVLLARRDQRVAAKAYVLVLVPVVAIVGSFLAYKSLAPLRGADVYATAGAVAHDLLTPEQRSKLVVVGPYAAPLHTALFYVDSPGARLLTVTGAVDESQLAAATAPEPFPASSATPEFALLTGVTWTGGELPFEVPGPGFSLVRLPGARTIDFTQASWLGLVSNVEGLSSPEGFGTWSDGDTVRITFTSSLPESFVLHLRGGAFGPNVGAPIWIQVGQERRFVTLGSGPEDVSIPFADTGSPSEISIEIPHPASPDALGSSSDPRDLGIWLAELRIAERP